MDADERRLFERIARTYLAAIGPDREYGRTEISIEPAPGRPFAVIGIVERVAGWRGGLGAGRGEGGRRRRRGGAPPGGTGRGRRAVGRPGQATAVSGR